MLELREVSVSYHQQEVLKQINLQIEPGTILGIIGPNGCGKSTLLKVIAQSVAYQGEILYGGKNAKDYTPKNWAKIIGVLPQKVEFPVAFDVKDVVQCSHSIHQEWWRLDSKNDRHHIHQLLRDLNIGHMATTPIHQLSGGEQQRVLLAALLAQNPEIALLDEPTNHLDLHYQIEILTQVKNRFSTIVTVLHDINLARQFCDRVLLINYGQIIADGLPDEVLTIDRLSEHFAIQPETYYHLNDNKSILSFFDHIKE